MSQTPQHGFANRLARWLLPCCGLLVALLALTPLIAVLSQALQADAGLWQQLLSVRLPRLLFNTVGLALVVVIASVCLGGFTAWLLAAFQLPMPRLLGWLSLAPLAIPPYVYAYLYDALFRPQAGLEQLGQTVFGEAFNLPGLQGFWPSAFVLTLAGYPYVFLLARSALDDFSRDLEDIARAAGFSRWQRLRRVFLPMLRPALVAGGLLVGLHVMADFGVVSLLRFETFTWAVYLQITGRFDYATAAALSLVLVLLCVLVLVLERLWRKRQRYAASQKQRRGLKKRPLAGWAKVAVLSWFLLLFSLAVFLPITVLSWWSWQAFVQTASIEHWPLLGYAWNSLRLAFSVTVLAVLLALPLAYWYWRRRSWLSLAAMQSASLGFVLPGPVVALGVIMAVLVIASPLYGSVLALVIALASRFLPVAIQAEEASLQRVSLSMLDSARTLGLGPLQAFIQVLLPAIRGGIAVAAVLVFVETLKELPATLIMRPVGFDTLPVRLWIEASEEMLEMAAPAALLLIIASAPAVILLDRWRQKH